MKSIATHQCKVHVLVCNNERPVGKPSCKPVGGEEFYFRLKNTIKDQNLRATHWVTRTGCLGQCNIVGCTVAIYRKGQAPEWFSEVTAQEFDEIWRRIVQE